MNVSPSGKRALQLDDVLAIERIQDVQISPDGASIAFVIGPDHNGKGALPESRIWLAPTDGSWAARPFTAGPGADWQPRWRPDGQALAFLSDRAQDGVLQVYTIPAHGGEARRLTESKGGVTDLRWSQDGSHIAYIATDGASEEDERRQRDKDDAIVIDRDYKYARLWVTSVEGDEARALTPAEYHVRELARFANGWAVVTSPTPKEDDFTLPWTLRQVSEGKPDTQLWQGTCPLLSLSASDDGCVLAWLHSGVGGGEPVDELWSLEAGGVARRALAEFAGGFAKALVTPDGSGFLLVGVAGTHHVVARLALAGGEPETLLRDRTLSVQRLVGDPLISIAQMGKRYACVLEDGTHLTEAWGGTPEEAPRQVTTYSAALQELRLGASEIITWQAPDGLTIEGIVTYPPTTCKENGIHWWR